MKFVQGIFSIDISLGFVLLFYTYFDNSFKKPNNNQMFVKIRSEVLSEETSTRVDFYSCLWIWFDLST